MIMKQRMLHRELLGITSEQGQHLADDFPLKDAIMRSLPPGCVLRAAEGMAEASFDR